MGGWRVNANGSGGRAVGGRDDFDWTGRTEIVDCLSVPAHRHLAAARTE